MVLWAIIPGRGGEYEADFLEHQHVGVGYGYEQDLRAVASRDELRDEHDEGPDSLWRFYAELETGALVAVPFTGSRVYVGEITGDYEFRRDVAPYHIRTVQWWAEDIPDGELDSDLFHSIRSEQAVHRVQVPGAEQRVRRLAWGRIDSWLERAQAFTGSGKLDADEMAYKREIIAALRRARDAVISGDGDWPALIRTAIGVPGSPWTGAPGSRSTPGLRPSPRARVPRCVPSGRMTRRRSGSVSAPSSAASPRPAGSRSRR